MYGTQMHFFFVAAVLEAAHRKKSSGPAFTHWASRKKFTVQRSNQLQSRHEKGKWSGFYKVLTMKCFVNFDAVSALLGWGYHAGLTHTQ